MTLSAKDQEQSYPTNKNEDDSAQKETETSESVESIVSKNMAAGDAEQNGVVKVKEQPNVSTESLCVPFDNFKAATVMKKLKFPLLIVLLALYIVFFVAVLLVPSRRDNDRYWCDGDGVLIIINSTAVALILYYKVFKVFLSRPLQKKMKPSLEKLRKFTQKRVVRLTLYGSPFMAFLLFLIIDTVDDRSRLVSAVGIILLVGLAALLSAYPRQINFGQIILGIYIQITFGLIVLRWSVGRDVFQCLGDKVTTFLSFTNVGSAFAFGSFLIETKTYVFAILSMILFFAMFVSALQYYGILQWIVIKLGWVLEKTLGTTPCESMSAAANIFLGLSEAPLVIKPYIPLLTKSELHAVMTGGYATVAGTVLGAYIAFGVDASHLLSASVMSAPAALVMSKLFYPETEISQTKSAKIKILKGDETSLLQAIMNGLRDAIPLIANISVAIIGFIALTAFLNSVLDWCCQLFDYDEGTCQIQSFIGYILMPIAWMMGVPATECYSVGYLLGTKFFVSEFLAYKDLTDMYSKGSVSARSVVITTYALCGFSSLSSMGCSLGALGILAPKRTADIAQLVFSALIAGNFACYLTACVAGTLIQDSSYRDLPFNVTKVLL